MLIITEAGVQKAARVQFTNDDILPELESMSHVG